MSYKLPKGEFLVRLLDRTDKAPELVRAHQISPPIDAGPIMWNARADGVEFITFRFGTSERNHEVIAYRYGDGSVEIKAPPGFIRDESRSTFPEGVNDVYLIPEA